jgi:hypothetical protein
VLVGDGARGDPERMKRSPWLTAALSLLVVLAAACTPGSAPADTPASKPRPAKLTFHIYIYSHLNQPWPVQIGLGRLSKRRDRLSGAGAVFSPTTFAYIAVGSANCVEAPTRLLRTSAHRVSMVSHENGGPFCLDDSSANLIVVIFNQPVLDPAHPVELRVRSTDHHGLRIGGTLVPRPARALHLRFGSITGRSLRRFPDGRKHPLPQRITVFGPARRRIQTDASGQFTVPNIPTGWYSVANCVGCPTNPDCHGYDRIFVHPDQTAQVTLVCRPLRT